MGSTGAGVSGVVVGAKLFPIHGDVRIVVRSGRIAGEGVLDVGIEVGAG